MAAGCLFTRLVLTAALLHPPGGRRDWPMSRESQELLVSINGLSAVVVKCGRNNLAGGVSELGDDAVTSLQQL